MRQPVPDDGVTLIEVLVTVALMIALLAIVVSGWGAWANSRAQSETAAQLRTVLRNTQQRAITEGVSMCVTFSDTAYTVWRGSCTSGDKVDGPIPVEGVARLSTPSFTPLVPSQSAVTATFSGRGTASAGSVDVVRPGSATVYEVKVDGFTGRAFVCHGGDCDAS